MKKLITILRSYLSLYCLLLLAVGASAQVHITSHIVPPYLNRVADYASHPELMLVTLTNLSNAEVQVQLTAKITGDNGISAWVKPGYRSPRAIAIQPGQSVNLNGNDVAFLFDISNIEYTGISRSDMTRGLGLLEGNYILCIRALQYNTLEPLSSDEPVGCTMFRISDLEPPRILTPFDEQQVDTKGVQVLPIVWTTPAGSSPNTEYTLKIVEMVVPGNPNEALQTTRPIFQETVHSNMLVYGPSHPALIQGRRYAMVVQAVDPLGQSNFRNRGTSEVVSFSYDAGGFVATEEGKVPVENKDEEAIDKKMATHLIKGKLLWTFKQSEEQFNKKSTFTEGNARDAIVAGIGTSATAVLAEGAVRSSANQSVQLVNTSPVTHYLSHSPLQLIRPTTVALVDPTLSARAAIVVSQGAPNIQPQTQDAASIISTSGAHGLSFTYENVKVAEGVDKHPLANAIITIKGVGDVLGSQKQSVPTLGVKAVTTRAQDIQFAGLRTTSSLKTMLQQEPATVGFSYLLNTKNNNTLASFNKFNEAEQNTTTVANVTANGTILASARTDGEGNFSMQMLDPRYEGQKHYNYLLLAVQQDGFEPFELRLDMDKLDSLSVLDLGEQLLLAKTYRFSPTVNVDVDKDSELSNPGMRVIVYRAESELRANPYLTYEGNLEAAYA